MRTAVLADIQGNAFALEHALQHISHEGADQIVCLGDVATGPEPRAVLDLLQQYHCLCVRGNMDEVVLNPQLYNGPNDDERKYAEMDRWCHEQLSEADLQVLRSWPLALSVEIGAQRALCFHGSPQSTTDVINSATPDEQLAELLGDVREPILLTGHMHLPMLRQFGDQLILNPGSIGLPYGGKRPMPTRADYLLMTTNGENVALSFHRVGYDAGPFRRRLLASGLPHAAWFLAKWQT
jgi:putative phosphoesterase